MFFSLCCVEVLSVLSQPRCLLLEEGRKKIPDAFVRMHHTSQKVCKRGFQRPISLYSLFTAFTLLFVNKYCLEASLVKPVSNAPFKRRILHYNFNNFVSSSIFVASFYFNFYILSLVLKSPRATPMVD